MKTYKNLKTLEEACKRNNRKPVQVWNDEGIKVNGRIYKVLKYGNMGYNFTGNEYITFYNKSTDSYITIEYKLTKPSPDSRTNNIFNFIKIRESY